MNTSISKTNPIPDVISNEVDLVFDGNICLQDSMSRHAEAHTGTGSQEGVEHTQQLWGLSVPGGARRDWEVLSAEKLPSVTSTSVKTGLVGPKSARINQNSHTTSSASNLPWRFKITISRTQYTQSQLQSPQHCPKTKKRSKCQSCHLASPPEDKTRVGIPESSPSTRRSPALLGNWIHTTSS